MTDPTLPPDDEIVSAVLDGEAGADERARVAADPAASARLARFDEVRRAVAAPVEVPAAARERAVAAALAQLEAPVGEGARPHAEAPDATGGADELAARRVRAARRARTGRILAAAAAFVLVLVGVGAVLRSATRSSNEATTSAAGGVAATSTTAVGDAAEPEQVQSAPNGAADAVTSTTAPGSAAGPVTTTAPAATAGPVPDQSFAALAPAQLGSLDSPGQLRRAMTGVVEQQLATSPTPTTVPPPTTPTGSPGDAGSTVGAAFTTCGSYLLAVDPELSQVVATADATYQGQPAIVYAFTVDQVRFPATNGSLRIYALDASGCSTLAVLTTDP